MTSITSSVLRGKVEDGRVYAVYGKEGMSVPWSGGREAVANLG
jgi:hypothetical protein